MGRPKDFNTWTPEKQEEWREKKRESVRKYQEANPEKRRESQRKWQKANPEKCRESHRKWKKANPEKCRELLRKLYYKTAAQKRADMFFKLTAATQETSTLTE